MNEMLAENVKILGPLSIVIIWLGLAFLVYKWPGKLDMSLSRHAAQTKRASVYYALLLMPAVTVFYIFMTKWFMPTFQLPMIAQYILATGVLGQYVACLVPDTKGMASKIHQVGGYTMSVTLGVMLGFIIFASRVSTTARWIDIFIVAIMVYLYGLFLFVPKARQRFLIYQSLYVALFHVAILVATYIR